MIKLYKSGVFLKNGREIVESPGAGQSRPPGTLTAPGAASPCDPDKCRVNTVSYGILKNHNRSGNMEKLNIKFDCLASHDITYVGIIQTARASGLERFPVPYVLTNCHNSLCAVGGTINEDDHLFGLTAAEKYGGVYVPAHQAVIHQYMRETMAACGKMILGSDSHTRYGPLGAMAIGEGGGELVKQLLGKTYDINMPEIAGVYLRGRPRPGVGPQDVALAIIGAVFDNGFVKNKVMEFVGEGVANLSVEYRIGIDVMTTETSCLSSVWRTDAAVRDYFETHGRPEAYAELAPGEIAYYDAFMEIDLSAVEPMIALPFHPSHVYTIRELLENPEDAIRGADAVSRGHLGGKEFSLAGKIRNGRLWADQAVIAGCAGGSFENLCLAADMLDGKSVGNGAFSLSAYPASQPVFYALARDGSLGKLLAAGVTARSAFCGPCFGAGDVPHNNGFSIRHTTRNFPNREGSKPADGQMASVALMDARSIAATALNGGAITSALDMDSDFAVPKYYFNKTIYDNRVYDGRGKARPETGLVLGPNIADWPAMPALPENLLLVAAAVIDDPVTTTDELIPSGDTSSYRSNPAALAEFTLSRKDPGYVGRAKKIREAETRRREGDGIFEQVPDTGFSRIMQDFGLTLNDFGVGSFIYARKPGDGSAREQAASCQKVLGGWANVAREYATKRYRSNLINWGVLPFTYDGEHKFALGEGLFIPGIREILKSGLSEVKGTVLDSDSAKGTEITLGLGELTPDERQILLDGCLINHYRPK
ncbi:MAG: hydratase [Firmicutes bacterium]|nr:hydratase [Bacillota bacterium]